MPISTPLTILTGFLGAGKTTLLNRILAQPHGLRMGVLVNDFGALNIDAELVVGVEANRVELANGCVCCSIQGELIAALEQLLDQPDPPQHILLEASGVADPGAIASSLVHAGLGRRMGLDGILCVVDAEQVFSAQEQLGLKLRQMTFADLVLLNKADLAGPERLSEVRRWVGRYLERPRLIETVECAVPLEVLLDTQGVRGLDAPDHACAGPQCAHPSHDHAQDFETWSYRSELPLSVPALRELLGRLPEGVYRAKGFVRAAEDPGRRALLQMVGTREEMTWGAPWGARPAENQIVFIGAPGSLDQVWLEQAIEACAAP